MGNFIKTQSSFANGVVAPEFYAHDSINGLAQLQNMDVLSSGCLRRRYGLTPVADLGRDARLIAFSVSEQENYLLALSDKYMRILHTDGTLEHNLITPWVASDLDKIQYAQRFGTIIFVHPDYEPRILKKSGDSFGLEIYGFATNNDDLSSNMPFMRFDDSENVTITVSTNAGGNNYATLTTNKDFWTPSSVGVLIRMLDKQWLVTEYSDARCVTVYVNGGYTLPNSPVSDWTEGAFSTYRGWPCSITFHQDRLVYGGSRSYPAGVWMSQVGRHNNFDTGTGLDDEAIFVTLISGQRQQICTVVSSENLQIMTNVGEWAISSKPLTPSSVDIRQYTSVGSISSRYLQPQRIEGATVFVSATERDIRELTLDDLGESYSATDLCAYAKHLMKNPVAISYNDKAHQLFVVMSDGTMAVLNHNSVLGISAWTTYVTSGTFRSVATVGEDTFVLVHRDDGFCIERFSQDALSDANGRAFMCIASGLPIKISGHNAKTLRVRKVTARIAGTKSIFINNHRVVLPSQIYDAQHPGLNTDVSINLLGTMHDFTDWPWQIHSSESLPMTVLSVTVYGFYTI